MWIFCLSLLGSCRSGICTRRTADCTSLVTSPVQSMTQPMNNGAYDPNEIEHSLLSRSESDERWQVGSGENLIETSLRTQCTARPSSPASSDTPVPLCKLNSLSPSPHSQCYERRQAVFRSILVQSHQSTHRTMMPRSPAASFETPNHSWIRLPVQMFEKTYRC